MSKQVPWNSDILNNFCSLALLNEEEIFIMETRIRGWSVSRQGMELGLSESAVAKRIALLKKKYDRVQEQHPDKLPPRRFSAKETWMDEH